MMVILQKKFHRLLNVTGTVVAAAGFCAVWIGCAAIDSPSVYSWGIPFVAAGLIMFVAGAAIAGGFSK